MVVGWPSSFLCLFVSFPFNKLDSPIIFPPWCALCAVVDFAWFFWDVSMNVMDVHWVGEEDDSDLVRMFIQALLCQWKFEGCSPFRSMEVFRCFVQGEA